jgi:hypothetical protein
MLLTQDHQGLAREGYDGWVPLLHSLVGYTPFGAIEIEFRPTRATQLART